MAICKVHICFLMLIAMVGFVTSTSDECLSGIGDVLLKCEKYLLTLYGKQLVPPSGDCCAAVVHAGVGCLLKFMDPSLKQAISQEKLLFVNKFCITQSQLHWIFWIQHKIYTATHCL
ncbi:hypothetical protein MKW94_009154 [Papaver nudicaule]|uniref:Bifunctional inhibitor/plant lipid transfer protein/seed storage helical domain-containing protein n=1 Tax=Papaver nudicaule TaxID=74823 RepID=A0AA42B313_PAPNU|nr:hypothetical protein [Papaver nudicaule]